MIAVMTFGPPRAIAGGRSLRFPQFERRSTLPASAACVVANGVRETLSRLLALEIDIEVVEPAVPASAERRVLVRDATIVRVRGRLCDGFVIVRPADARRLAALAFGETERSESVALSAIERETVDRIAAGLVPLCASLCGTLGPATREAPERAACDLATYFEVRGLGTTRFAIGFATSNDPREEVEGTLTLDDIAAVELEGRVEVASGALGVPAFSRIAPGAAIPFDTQLGSSGTLWFGDVTFARVTCGVAGGRNAATVDEAARA